jgi:diamine N-acetyltransferase
MTILGQKIRLRAIERNDIPAFVRWFNDPEVRQYLEMYLPMSQAQEENWFETQLDDDSGRIFGIETLDGALLGNIGLHRINWKDRFAELGIVIGERPFWSQGYGTDAIRTLLRFAFRQMNLHRVFLRVFEYNQRAMRCYEKCGFKLEGRLRQAHFHAGRYHDVVIMGILQEEFNDQ